MKRSFDVKNGLWMLAAFLLFLSLTGFPAAAEQTTGTLLTHLQTHKKLHAPDDILADFAQGRAETAVIVHLQPTAAAKELAARSKRSKQVPAEFAMAGAPPFYDLHDDSVRKQLRTTVGDSVSHAVDQLGPGGIRVTHKFSYQFGFAARVSPAALERIVNSPDVLLVEKDAILQPHLAQGIPLMNALTPRATYTGAGLSIAICDTGIDSSHVALGGGSGIFNAKVIGGYDTGDNDGDPRPGANGEAHGTNCAGIAAGYTGTEGDYIGGVAPGAKLYAIKISSGTDGSATTSAMIAGWEWAVTHKNDDPANPILVISTSFGGGGYSTTCDSASPGMTTAAANAVAAGITIFASSGNDGYCGAIAWPACISYVNSVGAVYDASFGTYYPCVSSSSCATKKKTSYCTTGWYATDVSSPDKVTSYSNTSSLLTLLAPSNQAYTTDIVGTGGYASGDYYSGFGGTSAACPYAAGSAAVLQQAAKAKTGSYLTPAQVRSYLAANGDNVTDSKVAITRPRINLGRAIDALPAGAGDFTIAVTPATITVAPGGSAGATITSTVSGGFTDTVSLSVAALPTGVTVDLNPATIAAPGSGSATLTLTVPSDATAGTYSLTASATGGGITRTAPLTLVIRTPSLPLADALDTSRPLFTGGDAVWSSQGATTHDGSDAAQAGTITDMQSSWMETTVNGPDTLSFWWKVSSELNYDILRFSIDGAVQDTISGDVAWTQVSHTLPPGPHTLRWEYTKDELVSGGLDTGWVDQLRLTSQATLTIATSAGAGGSITPTTTVNYGGSVTVTVTPDAGYHIASVLVDGVGQTVTDPKGFSYPFTNVTTDHSVSATFAVDSFTVIYNGNGATGGTVPVDTSPHLSGSTVTLPGVGDMTRTGSVFTGWNTLADGTGTGYAAGDTFTITADVTLYARWTAVTNVALQTNGGVAAASSAVTATYAAATVNNGDLTGKTWGTSATQGGWADATLNVWPDWVTITFNGLKTINEIDVVTLQDRYALGTVPVKNVTTFTNLGLTGYDVQYCTLPAGQTCLGSNEAHWVTLGSIRGNNLVWRSVAFTQVAAQAVRVKTAASIDGRSRIVEIQAYGAGTSAGGPACTVTYSGNGNTGGSVPVDPDSPYASGSTVTVLVPGTLAKTGATFSGWNTLADGSGISHPPGTTFTITGDVTLHALWTALPTYTVTYDGNGNTGGTAPVDPGSPYVSGSTVTVLAPGALTRTDSVFSGWNTLADNSGISYPPGATLTITGDVTLYAQWTTPASVTNVALQANGGVATASSTVNASYPASATNNGDPTGRTWGSSVTQGGWADATLNGYPDWVMITFNGQKSINEIGVVTLQDSYTLGNVPVKNVTTFKNLGLTGYEVQYCTLPAGQTCLGTNDAQWATAGSISGNTLVWRSFTFSAVSTHAVRVKVTGTKDGRSRIVEIEAYGQ